MCPSWYFPGNFFRWKVLESKGLLMSLLCMLLPFLISFWFSGINHMGGGDGGGAQLEFPNSVNLSHSQETRCILRITNQLHWVHCSEVDEPRVCHHTDWSKSEREKQIPDINIYMESGKIVLMKLFAGKDSLFPQMQRMDLRTQRGKERVGQIERILLTYIHYHV